MPWGLSLALCPSGADSQQSRAKEQLVFRFFILAVLVVFYNNNISKTIVATAAFDDRQLYNDEYKSPTLISPRKS